MRTGIIITVIVAAALFWFNPDMDAFKDFAAQQAERLLLNETGDSGLGRILSGVGGNLAGQFVDRFTERSNFLVCSLYTIDLDEEGEGDEWRFLGIAGQFVTLSRPESFNEETPTTEAPRDP